MGTKNYLLNCRKEPCVQYAKGDRKWYNKCKGMSLLNIKCKTSSILLYNQLNEIIEPEIGN